MYKNNILTQHWQRSKVGVSPALQASPGVISIQSCTVKLDEEKSKYASLVHKYGSGSLYLVYTGR